MRTLEHHPHASEKISRNRARLQSEEVLDLGAGDEEGDTVGEAYDYRTRNEFDCRSEACDSKQDKQTAGHYGTQQEPIEAIAGEDTGDDDNKRTRRTTNLVTGTA